MVVLDASAAAAVLLNFGTEAPLIRERIGRAGDDLHAPYLFEIEVASVLRRHTLGGVLSPDRARLALNRLSTLSITLYPHSALLPRVWELKENLTTYDAAYVALAETLSTPLITTDARLARAPGIRAEVEVHG